MNLALIVSLAFPLAAAAAVEGAVPESWGTEKTFSALLADVIVGGRADDDDQPSYCYMPPPRPTCFKDGYPECCTETNGNCPEKQPGCECDGDCTAEVSCLYPNEDKCGDDQFCMIQTGGCRLRSAHVSGTCTEMPNVCVLSFQPVCGCDGKTYSNSCVAASQGVNVEQDGECPEDKRRPGTCLFPNDDECGDDQFCKIRTGDCRLRSANVRGRCRNTPDMCKASYDPVCGCDGKTYSNSCKADGAGVNIVHEGECPDDRDYCDKPDDFDCYKRGVPKCCLEEDQDCPPNHVPRCDKGNGPGWDYCAWQPDYDCYKSGRPACCDRFDGTNCPSAQPNCDHVPTENSEDESNVKFLRNH